MIQHTPASACIHRMVTGFRAKYEAAKMAVANHPITSGTGTLSTNRIGQRSWRVIANRHNVGRDLVPLLNDEALLFQEGADLGTLPPDDFFKNRNQHTQRIVAEHGSFCDRREVFIF